MATDTTRLPATDPRASARYAFLGMLLRSGRHDLTRDELAQVLPPRGPRGSPENQHRGRITRTLNGAGFTFQGRRL